jgi:hypothetical protein
MKQSFQILKGALPQKSSHVMFVLILGESMKNVATLFKIESEVGNSEIMSQAQ